MEFLLRGFKEFVVEAAFVIEIAVTSGGPFTSMV